MFMTVKELRSITGLSQSKFAKKYKFTDSSLRSWEQGQRNTPKCILYLLERCVREDYKEKFDGEEIL